MAVAPAPARPRPGGGRLFIIVGLLLAVLAFGGVFLLGNTFGGGGGGGGPTTTVVVSKQAIPLRHTITTADLDVAKVSGSFTSARTEPSGSGASVTSSLGRVNAVRPSEDISNIKGSDCIM